MVVRILLVLIALSLTACGGWDPRREEPKPAPVPEPVPQAQPQPQPQPGQPRISAYRPPTQHARLNAKPRRAVNALLSKANRQRRAGRLSDAVASLERALRVSPDDARVWNRLAEIRADQGEYGLAAEFAERSNSLADPVARGLRRNNWKLIARSRRAVGDTAGARVAEQRAAELR